MGQCRVGGLPLDHEIGVRGRGILPCGGGDFDFGDFDIGRRRIDEDPHLRRVAHRGGRSLAPWWRRGEGDNHRHRPRRPENGRFRLDVVALGRRPARRSFDPGNSRWLPITRTRSVARASSTSYASLKLGVATNRGRSPPVASRVPLGDNRPRHATRPCVNRRRFAAARTVHCPLDRHVGIAVGGPRLSARFVGRRGGRCTRRARRPTWMYRRRRSTAAGRRWETQRPSRSTVCSANQYSLVVLRAKVESHRLRRGDRRLAKKRRHHETEAAAPRRRRATARAAVQARMDHERALAGDDPNRGRRSVGRPRAALPITAKNIARYAAKAGGAKLSFPFPPDRLATRQSASSATATARAPYLSDRRGPDCGLSRARGVDSSASASGERERERRCSSITASMTAAIARSPIRSKRFVGESRLPGRASSRRCASRFGAPFANILRFRQFHFRKSQPNALKHLGARRRASRPRAEQCGDRLASSPPTPESPWRPSWARRPSMHRPWHAATSHDIN